MTVDRPDEIDLRDHVRVTPIAPIPVERTAFVLAGGSTRGAGQVGMLRALSELGIAPDLVVGTSVGAMNGAAYVADPSVEGIDDLDRVWGRARRSQIFPIAPRAIVENVRERRGYLFANDGIRDWIASHLRHDQLEDFPIPLHVVATEVETSRPVVLSSGDALASLLASTAIPGVFPPVDIDGTLLYDGGVAADIPLPQALDLGATTIYVLSTLADSTPRTPTGWQLLDRVFGRPFESQEFPPSPDVTVHWLPAPVFTGNPYSFRESRRLIDEARDLTHAHLGQTAEVVG